MKRLEIGIQINHEDYKRLLAVLKRAGQKKLATRIKESAYKII